MEVITCYLNQLFSVYWNSFLYIRLHVGTVRHGAHQHVQRPSTNAKLHNGQQPAYASRSQSAWCSLTTLHLVHGHCIALSLPVHVKPEFNSLSAVICLNCSLMQPPFHSQVRLMNWGISVSDTSGLCLFLSLCFRQARPHPILACCPPVLQWMGGAMMHTRPLTCRHTWTANRWPPRARPPRVSLKCFL